MGCDIHAHIEYSQYEHDGKPMWWHYCTFFFLRDYCLFALMAGVRAYDGEVALVEPRGVPEDYTHDTKSAYSLLVSETNEGEGYCTQENAERYVRNGSKWLTKPDAKYPLVSHPYWHTPSWLTTAELRGVTEKYIALHPADKPYPNFYAALAAMQAFEDAGLPARLVFWFDN